jgi:hypothetical protein
LPPHGTTATRPYRLQFRDASNALARAYDVNLGSNEEARELAALMLEEQGIYSSVEIWDPARIICILRTSDHPSKQRG